MVTPPEAENRIDSRSLRTHLKPSERPANVPSELIDESIRRIAQRAQRRLVMNQTGGLPGPEIHRRSRFRKFLDIFGAKQ